MNNKKELIKQQLNAFSDYKKELIKQQLNAFSGWLGCYIRQFEYAAEAAANVEDQIKFAQAMASKRLLEETADLFKMVQENIEDLINEGDDGER